LVSVKSVRRIGAASMVLPTCDHVIAPSLTMVFAPALMQSVFGPGAVAAVIFFIVLGIYQLIWIGVLLKSNNLSLLVLGIPGNLLSVLIYFVSMSGVTIFGVPPQQFSLFAVLIKALESVFILASINVLKGLRGTY